MTDGKIRKDFNEIPLSESSVSLKLADVQRRCSELLLDADDPLELSLEDPVEPSDGRNPYDRG